MSMWFEIALWKRILGAMILGVIVGVIFGDGVTSIAWIGDLFIRLIRMVVVPLVFVTLVSGVISMGDPSKLGSLGARTLGLYLFTTLAGDEILIDSIASLKVFNEQDMDIRAPYGQAEIDMMDELNYNGAEIEELRAEIQGNARFQLDRIFEELNIDVLISVNNQQAGIAALANYPALTIPMGYEEDGRPISITFIAPSFQEQLLIDVGVQFERLTEARQTPTDYM